MTVPFQEDPTRVMLDDVADVAESGGLALFEPGEAFSAISSAASDPSSPLDPRVLTGALTDIYVADSFSRWNDAALAAASDFRAWRVAGAAPVLGGALGVPDDAYEMADEAAAEGDPSLRASLRAAFLGSL